ncbi:MAG TPA: hypothetical protein VKY89_07725 [Thermoanaerobaculia bacterium]|jgi:hypothetical protein|nr:hypothetical protein [Thermoanaerobaculia bacterium]
MLRKLDTGNVVTFEVSSGFTVRASSASIAFLWSNWEVLFAFAPQHIRSLRSVTDQMPGVAAWDAWDCCGHWEASGFGGRGRWSLERAEIGVRRGRFAFFTDGRALGCPFRARTVMEYTRVDDLWISYRGTGLAALPKNVRLLHPLLRLLGSRITIYINKLGGEVAELITREPEKVREAAGDTAWEIYQRFIREEDARRNGHFDRLSIFTLDDSAAPSASEDLGFLTRKLERIEALLESLHTQGLDSADYRASLSVFSHDPTLALVKNRLIIERLINLVYEREIEEAPYDRDIRTRLSDLKNKTLNVPKGILVLMTIVVDLGDSPNEGKKHKWALDYSAYTISFEAALRITEWFFIDYLQPGVRLEHA